MGPKSAKKRSRRTHSLGGCGTCRRRHVKCDQIQPTCLTCRAVGVTCEGYSASVQWMQQGQPGGDVVQEKAGTRRHLYSEKSRASMSTSLTEQFGSSSVDASLNEIDIWSKGLQDSRNEELSIGPFSVLNFNAMPDTVLKTISPELIGGNMSEVTVPTPSTLDPLATLDDSLQWADLFELDFDNFLATQPDFFSQPEDFNNVHPTNQDQQEQAPNNALNSMDLTSPTPTTNDPDLIDAAPELLRHFSDNVVAAMAPLPFNTKSPWKILNVSAAIQTLAHLTYLNRSVKHANAANFYGILACSAHHLASNSSSPTATNSSHWTSLKEKAAIQAKSHLQKSLRAEFSGPDKAKYKDQLMAILSVTAVAIFSGLQKDVRCYMLDAERLLRVRGLAKRDISRRARLLHHIYTWVRIIGESTYVLHDFKAQASATETLQLRNDERRKASAKIQTGHNARLDDFLRLENQDDSDLEIEEKKEPQVGLHDIHLEDAREDSNTMYLQIYGLPETWLSLVSQTTRLANILDMLKSMKKDAASALQNSLQRRAARLEDMICSFAARTDDTAESDPSRSPSYHMLRALNSALVIFFSRRIKDVNPWILQGHVDDVITALRDFDASLLQHNIPGPGTPWPAFIAGCEARSNSRRQVLSDWMDSAYMKTALSPFKSAQNMMREVWRRRDNISASPKAGKQTRSTTNTAQSIPSWVEISREMDQWVMLS